MNMMKWHCLEQSVSVSLEDINLVFFPPIRRSKESRATLDWAGFYSTISFVGIPALKK